MAKRSPRQQSKHDKGVQTSAEYYEQQGYEVKADLPDYPRPPIMGGRRPDLVATKRKETVLEEVETRDSFEKDKDQRAAFKEYADARKNTRFWTKKV
jgi:hypothetical protein